MLAIEEFMNNNKHTTTHNFCVWGGAYFHSSDNYNIEVFFLVAIIPNRVWVKGI